MPNYDSRQTNGRKEEIGVGRKQRWKNIYQNNQNIKKYTSFMQ